MRFARTFMIPMALLILWVEALAAQSNEPEVMERWYRLTSDSVLVEFALPSAKQARPAIVVLTDRFGMQKAVRTTLQILAMQGFRVYAIPLISAPGRTPTGTPETALDSLDVDIIAQVVVDIRNEAGCDGNVGMLGFDVGATAGLIAAQRLPLFKSCVVFYPAFHEVVQEVLPNVAAPMLVKISQYDGDFSMARLQEIRETLIEHGRKVQAVLYKDCKQFFFNPKHEHYHKKNTQKAWNELIRFFRSTLSSRK